MAEIPYGHRLLPQVVDEAARENPSRVIGMIAKSSDISQGFHDLTTSQLANAVNYAAWWIEEKIGKSKNFDRISYVGVTDFRYWAIEFAAIKAGYVALLTSPRNSIESGISLLEETNCNVIFYSSAMESKCRALQAAKPEIQIFQVPKLLEMMNTPATSYLYTKTWEEAKNDIVSILHTSGSTGIPKPICHNNIFCGLVDLQQSLPQPDGHKISGLVDYGKPNSKYYLGFPLFHLGGYAMILASIYYEAIVVLGPAESPPNGKVVSEIMRYVKPETLCAPPSIFEDLVKEYSDAFLENVGDLETVIFAGGPLSPEVGDFLAQYVQVDQVMGSTEAGLLINLKQERKDWQWFKWHPTHGGFDLDRIGDSDLYEMVIRRSPAIEHTQGIFQTFPELNEWSTKDIYRKHATKDMYLYQGRNDDVMVLSNGEKFNPVSMEGMVSGHSKVLGALAIGARRNQCGLLLEGNDVNDPEQLIAEVWPTIEEANKSSPGHAQIGRNMVKVVHPSKPFPRTSKGTIMRHAAVTDFADEINSLYKNSGETINIDIKLPELEDSSEITFVQKFVHEIVAIVLNEEVFSDSEDFYVHGMDSLQTTQLANTLKIALQSQADASKFGSRLIYENPTVEKLALAVRRIVNPQSCLSQDSSDSDAERISNMKSMLERITQSLPKRVTEPLTVVLTGSTGSLGYYCLETMMRDPKIKKIYCLNRAADGREKFLSRIAQITSSLNDLGLGLLDSKVEFYQSAFGEPNFGLDDATHAKLTREVDAIIHNAWKVDFNHLLESFEAVHVNGVRNFIELSLLSPRHPSLNFISSISTMGNWGALYPGQIIPERIATDEEWRAALPMGYGESKLVAEHMLYFASQAGIRANVLRVGQIGGPVNRGDIGVWNHQEWLPSLVKSSKSLGAVPNDLGAMNEVDWIPVDKLANVVVDLVHSTSSPTASNFNVFNLVNPQRVPFNTLIPAIVDAFSTEDRQIEVVSPRDWIERLLKLDSTDQSVLADYPSLKIMDFYQGLLATEGEGLFATDMTKEYSSTMRDMEPISKEILAVWLRQWAY